MPPAMYSRPNEMRISTPDTMGTDQCPWTHFWRLFTLGPPRCSVGTDEMAWDRDPAGHSPIYRVKAARPDPLSQPSDGSESRRRSLVASLGNGGNNVIDGGLGLVVVDLDAGRGEVDLHILDTLELANLLFDLLDTRGAGEALGVSIVCVVVSVVMSVILFSNQCPAAGGVRSVYLSIPSQYQ